MAARVGAARQKRKDFILRGGSAARFGMAGAKEDKTSTLRKGFLQKVVVPGKVGLLAGCYALLLVTDF